MSMHLSGQIPPEIWQMVLRYLPQSTTRECLFVSRVFHDLAARSLFSTLRIQFGSWQFIYGVPITVPIRSSGQRSCAALLRIITDPVFASYVKHLYILAFATNDAIFELCCLTKAISALHNLRTFVWYTNTTITTMIPDTELLETLASTCTHLREYDLPIQSLDALHALKQLAATNIALYDAQRQPWDVDPQAYDTYRSRFALLLEARRGSLARLTAPSQAIWECPIHILQELSDLTIDDACHLGNITLLFHHCHERLESLQIVLYCPGDSTDLFAALAANPNALPHLTHLKLYSPSANEMERRAFGGFIQTKKKLRCLDYNDEQSTIDDLSLVMQSLPDLEVLGIHLAFHVNGEAQLCALKRAIPGSLTALRLWLDYSDLDQHCSWIDLWTGLPKLVFTHIDDNKHHPIVETLELATACTSLRLVGHGPCFREVERMNDGVTLSNPWSQTKVEFRTAADFGSRDWEWLMRDYIPPEHVRRI
ncbi:uncharacterized protein B0H18DRAFT_1211335 [Fomitopsis serialis]|uniref:uncharacterized protein n=1 Tax=Fomitopsis serialis TaxID=139415 RepID=UPI0020085BA1|nr:uncharacterized protein B0H18DRAFT_1211335 [Neoantrodia serialis]KAH9925772.1 hypothetical protein B0H18DRAFT_1211335 [Neoantrodia serialis]